MAKMLADIRSFADAEAFLATGDVRTMTAHADIPDSRRLGHNTTVEALSWTGTRPHAIAIRYHRTNIVVYRADGAVRLTTGGWWSTTTKQRLNACTPYAVYSEGAGEWGVSGRGDSARFVDDMWSDTDGRWQAHKAAQFSTHMGRATR